MGGNWEEERESVCERVEMKRGRPTEKKKAPGDGDSGMV